jgi:hypothetical protein
VIRSAAANPGANEPLTLTAPGGERNFTLIDAKRRIDAETLTATDSSSPSKIDRRLEGLNGQTLARVEWMSDEQLILH